MSNAIKNMIYQSYPAKSKIYCGYTIKCPVHGYKSACWTIDPIRPGEDRHAIIADCWKRQHDEVTAPNHATCGKWSYVLTLRAGTKKQLDAMIEREKALSSA